MAKYSKIGKQIPKIKRGIKTKCCSNVWEVPIKGNFVFQGLLDVTCKTVANMIKGKTPEEIRKTFNIKNDFTPSEEEQVEWAHYICCENILI